MALESTVHLSITGKHTGAADLGTPTMPFALSKVLTLTNGTGANQVDRVYVKTRTLAASATEDLDLAAVLLDTYGQAITMAKIKVIVIVAADTNGNDVNVTRPATNGVPWLLAAGDGIGIKPGGFQAWGCPGTGVTVTAGTGDLITVTNAGGGTAVTYSIVIMGTSA